MEPSAGLKGPAAELGHRNRAPILVGHGRWRWRIACVDIPHHSQNAAGQPMVPRTNGEREVELQAQRCALVQQVSSLSSQSLWEPSPSSC
jgi:hypothetical protein